MILVECYPDMILLEELGFFDVKHGRGKGNICNILRKKRNCIGIVDEDPDSPQPRYMQILKERARNLQRHDITIIHDKTRSNCLIIIRPKLEDWILKTARLAGINVKDYGLPNDPLRLSEIISQKRPPDKFRKLIRDLLNTDRLQTLKSLIQQC